MRRREFIAGLGSAVAVPHLVRAQQHAVPVVGFLRSTRAQGFEHLTEILRAGLNESGFEAGRNVAVESHWADEQPDRLRALTAELVKRPVAIIVANSVAALAAKAATTTVPIVFVTGADPVGGLVTAINRPGGNLTGVSWLSGESGGKRLELLRQLVPSAATIAVLVDPRTNEGRLERLDLEAAAKAIGQELFVVEITADRDIEPGLADCERKAGALLIGAGAYFTAGRQSQLAALALRHKLPTAHAQRGFATAGGLYGLRLQRH